MLWADKTIIRHIIVMPLIQFIYVYKSDVIGLVIIYLIQKI